MSVPRPKAYKIVFRGMDYNRCTCAELVVDFGSAEKRMAGIVITLSPNDRWWLKYEVMTRDIQNKLLKQFWRRLGAG